MIARVQQRSEHLQNLRFHGGGHATLAPDRLRVIAGACGFAARQLRTRERQPAEDAERFVAGDDHRILVIDGRMVAAAKRIPGHVVGDGERTIAELVEATNADPRRGREYDKVMVRLEFDAQAEQVLTEAGLTRASVPERGRMVPLRRTANVSTGGTCASGALRSSMMRRAVQTASRPTAIARAKETTARR